MQDGSFLILVLPLFLILFWVVVRGEKPRTKPRYAQPHGRASGPRSAPRTLSGPAYIIDGDSLLIQRREIRLYGVDAPEMNHPYGKKAKWALVKLCKGRRVHAEILAIDHYDRTVAKCTLDDGRDLSAEMVKMGLALDWPKFSGRDYAHLEPEGIRRKLWLADARQKGRMHVWAQFEAREKARNQAP